MVERKHWQLCKKQKVSLRGVYLWAVNSTVTKHSDYFVWKDTQEHVTWWCNDTSWQEANKFLCMKTPFGGSSATKNNRQRTMLSLTHSGHQCHVSKTLRLAIWNRFLHCFTDWWTNYHIYSGPKILKSCLLHCCRDQRIVQTFDENMYVCLLVKTVSESKLQVSRWNKFYCRMYLRACK